LWEQYGGRDEEEGKGQRSHPFSGWTSLVVNIMAELY
jgi:mannosyl-oligosaccharide glucosidase